MSRNRKPATTRPAPSPQAAPEPAPAPAVVASGHEPTETEINGQGGVLAAAAEIEVVEGETVGTHEPLPEVEKTEGDPLPETAPVPAENPATIEPKRYEDKPAREDDPRIYSAGDASPSNLYAVGDDIVETLEPGTLGFRFAREGCRLSAEAAAHLNGK